MWICVYTSLNHNDITVGLHLTSWLFMYVKSFIFVCRVMCTCMSCKVFLCSDLSSIRGGMSLRLIRNIERSAFPLKGMFYLNTIYISGRFMWGWCGIGVQNPPFFMLINAFELGIYLKLSHLHGSNLKIAGSPCIYINF